MSNTLTDTQILEQGLVLGTREEAMQYWQAYKKYGTSQKHPVDAIFDLFENTQKNIEPEDTEECNQKKTLETTECSHESHSVSATERKSFIYDGIPVNPQLPENFDIMPQHERPEEEMKKWYGVPYILIVSLKQEPCIEHLNRLTIGQNIEAEICSQWLSILKKDRERWYECYPDGFKYMVRILDDSSWDSTTLVGSFDSFDKALIAAKKAKF